MTTIGQDVRYGFRMLARSPGFTAVAVLTLALGIGATAAIFSVVNGVLLRPLAYPEAQRLVWLHEFMPVLAAKFPVLPVNARHFMEWRQRCSSFASLSLIHPGATNLTGRGEPEVLNRVAVSANLFETLRVQPALGRAFLAQEDEEGHSRVAVLSDRFWRRKFSAAPSILGTTATLDNEVYTIVGVLPPDFRLPNPDPFDSADLAINAQPDVYIPKAFTQSDKSVLMGQFNFAVLGRLKPGVTRGEALAELNVIGAELVTMAGEKLELRAVVKPLKEAMVGDSRRGLLLLLGAVGVGLLIACLNLASLGLVRAEQRSFDSAVRTALGATRSQLLRQALTQTGLVALVGAALGILAADAGLRILVRIAPSDIPRLDEVRIDGPVLLFALALTVGTMLLSGLLPAWRTAQSRPEHVLRTAGRTATAAGLRMRSALVSMEVGLSVILLIVAGLLLNSFSRVTRADKGFDAPTVLAADVLPPQAKYYDWDRIRELHSRLLEEVTSAPGVRSAAIVSALPLEGETWVSPVWIAGDTRRDLERPMANVRFVSEGYFGTMGIPLLEGRVFSDTDRSRAVAVVSRRLARALWPQEELVVGRRFLHESGKEYEVVGVAADVRTNADREAVPIVYRPYWDGAPEKTVIVARALGDPFSIAGAVRAAIRHVDADVPISTMRTMREVLDRSVSQRCFQMRIASVFAVCALLLAALGIYGVVAHSVAQRTREMGIRAALGARPVDLSGMVLLRGMAPVGFGLLAGVVSALAAGRLLQSLLYGISPYDPLTISVVALVVLTVALLACYVPARRAARIDPMIALRYE